MKKLLTSCSAIIFILSAVAQVHAIPNPGNNLTNLLVPGATITSGDKVFSNFTWTSSAAGSGTAVSSNDVAVVPFSHVVLGELEYGLQFFTPTFALPAGGGLSGTLGYTVTPNIPGRLISDNTLTMVSAVTFGNGNASITETATQSGTGVPLASKTTIDQGIVIPNVLPILFVHADYPTPVLSVDVNTQLSLANAVGQPGPAIRSFTQTFSQVPEPATLGLAGLAVLGLVGFARLRK
jgi:hypothetical protein